jgi:cyclic lactone autoinducer peptide
MVKKIVYGLATSLSMFAAFAVSVASYVYVYQGDTPEELLKYDRLNKRISKDQDIHRLPASSFFFFLKKKSGAPIRAPEWERRNRTKSLWGNVSLLRGCLRHWLNADILSMPTEWFFIPAACRIEKKSKRRQTGRFSNGDACGTITT